MADRRHEANTYADVIRTALGRSSCPYSYSSSGQFIVCSMSSHSSWNDRTPTDLTCSH